MNINKIIFYIKIFYNYKIMESKEINNINESFSASDSKEKKKKSKDFNISYILIKIDDNLLKKKYPKVLKVIKKIEKENKEILLKKENLKYFIYLFEIKVICLCRIIELKISDSFLIRKNSLILNAKSDNIKLLEKSFEKLKKILEETMEKLKIYMSYKDVITDNMKEHIILTYARGIHLQGKFCKLKKQISDATSFFNIGINLLSRNINKSIESETFCLFGKFLISLSCILIEDESYLIATDKIVDAINYFIKALFLTIDNPNGINIDEINKKIKNNSFIFSIKGLIISLFLLGISLEKLDYLDNAVTLYNQSHWIFKKFFKNIDPIFYSIIHSIKSRINKIKEGIIREIKNKYIEEKRLEKLRMIEQKNFLKALRLTNISNRGVFNTEKYLKMEKKLKNVLINIEKKYGKRDEDGKIFLPIIRYLNLNKNKFEFTFNYLVKEKQKQMEKKLGLEKNKNNKALSTDNNINFDENNLKRFKTININLSNTNIFKRKNYNLYMNSFDNNINNFMTLNNKKTFSYKDKLRKKFPENKKFKILNEEMKSEENEYFETKPDSIYSNIIKSNSYTINNNIHSLSLYRRFPTTHNVLNKKLNSYNSFDNKSNKKNTEFKNYIINSKNERNKQKKFLTKNSYVFGKSFRKGIKYLEKMDQREINFQKQLINLKDLEFEYEQDLKNKRNLKPVFSKDKIIQSAKDIYMKIKDKINDKLKTDNTIEITTKNEKSKEIDKILVQKMKVENSLIMGLNESKIDEIKKLEQNLEEINKNNYIKMLGIDYKNYKKKDNKNIDNEKMNEIEYVNKKNNEIMDNLDNEIFKCEQKNIVYKKRKKNFYLPNHLKKNKIKESYNN